MIPENKTSFLGDRTQVTVKLLVWLSSVCRASVTDALRLNGAR